MSQVEVTHFHLCSGIGSGARGFNKASARVGSMTATYRCLGGVDNDAGAVRSFKMRTGVDGTVLDLHDRDGYRAWNGCEPPDDWREATPADIRRAAGNERPNIVFISAPCKGFSGLLNTAKAKSEKYLALNRLTLRALWLALEAWADDPPEFFVFENVPLIATRGRWLLDQIIALLQRYGYATAETTHDCGELGGLAQHRRRYLLMSRHIEKVPPFLYEPRKRRVRGVGEVLGQMPLPGDPAAGVMHRIPALQWKTWVRLALIPAGKDWRALNDLAVQNGVLRDYAIVPDASYHAGILGVMPWDKAAGTITGRSSPSTGTFAVADVRWSQSKRWNSGQQLGVMSFDAAAGAVNGQCWPGQGVFSVADPRVDGVRHANVYRVIRCDQSSPTVTGGTGPSNGSTAVADPRVDWHPAASRNKYRVIGWGKPAGTAIGARAPSEGAGVVADPRLSWGAQRPHYQTGGHYGVVAWDQPSYTIPGRAKLDRGPWSVADPRMPALDDRGAYVIRSLDDTWHRPFTTLEMAALQSMWDPETGFALDDASDSTHREWIGNAVPEDAAAAIASEIGRTLLLARAGETFVLDSAPIWVRPIAVALSLSHREELPQ